MRTKIDIHRPALQYDLREEGVAGENNETLPPTVVVYGVPRGGTTMVAGIVQRCGVDIGLNLPVNLEDPDFVAKKPAEMIETIRDRNQDKAIWGWKFPRAANYLPAVHEEIRNPHYIVVWRDIFSTGLRPMRRGGDIIESLRHAHTIQRINIDTMKKVPGRYLLVSYEKAVLDPWALAEDISAFVGTELKADRDELIAFAKPGSYKS